MQTERQRQATEIRAQGEQAARRIRAEADRTATVIVAEANGEVGAAARRRRGDAEPHLAEAFSADPDFFAFYRSMQAYQDGLGGSRHAAGDLARIPSSSATSTTPTGQHHRRCLRRRRRPGAPRRPAGRRPPQAPVGAELGCADAVAQCQAGSGSGRLHDRVMARIGAGSACRFSALFRQHDGMSMRAAARRRAVPRSHIRR